MGFSRVVHESDGHSGAPAEPLVLLPRLALHPTPRSFASTPDAEICPGSLNLSPKLSVSVP